MEPNQGVVAGEFRLLIVSSGSGEQHWYWWIVSLLTMFQGDAERDTHELRVQSTSDGATVASRRFGRLADAKAARRSFAELAESGGVDSLDRAEIQAMVDSLPTA